MTPTETGQCGQKAKEQQYTLKEVYTDRNIKKGHLYSTLPYLNSKAAECLENSAQRQN